LSISSARLIQSTPTHPISLKSILTRFTHLHLGLSSGLMPSDFPTNKLHEFLCSPFVLHVSPMSSSSSTLLL
jgi:hypothetical protein